MTLNLFALLAALAVLVGMFWKLEDQRRQDEAERLVDRLLSPRAQSTLDEITQMVSENKHVLGRHHAAAQERRRAGESAEAVERMRLGCQAIETMAPDFVRALQALRRLARTASVIVPLPPVRVGAFRAWELRGLAGLGAFGHDLLVTGGQQMRLHVVVIQSAVRLGVRALRRSTERLPRREREWQRIDALVADLALSGDEGVATARRILAAVDASADARQ